MHLEVVRVMSQGAEDARRPLVIVPQPRQGHCTVLYNRLIQRKKKGVAEAVYLGAGNRGGHLQTFLIVSTCLPADCLWK